VHSGASQRLKARQAMEAGGLRAGTPNTTKRGQTPFPQPLEIKRAVVQSE